MAAAGEVENGTHPIAFLRYRYNRVREDAFEDGTLTASSGRASYSGSGDPFTEAEAFAVGVLAGEIKAGEGATFTYDATSHYSNETPQPLSLSIDFGDGAGYRTVNPGGSVTVTYATEGAKRVDVVAHYSGFSRHSSSQVYVSAQDDCREPDFDTRPNTPISAGSYNNRNVNYHKAYYYGSGNASLTQPIIVTDGFDPNNARGFCQIYEILNQESIADDLLAQGYDLVFIDWGNGTDYIQANSLALQHLIESVNTETGRAPLVLVGPSMGALVSRHALLEMEARGEDHNVDLFISFDGPNEGAHVPLSFQAAILYSADIAQSGYLPVVGGTIGSLPFVQDPLEDAVSRVLRVVDSPAARQMLLQNIFHAGGPAPERTQFVTEMQSLGEYPRDSRNVAVAKGSGLGLLQCNEFSGSDPSSCVERASPGEGLMYFGADLPVVFSATYDLRNTPVGSGRFFSGGLSRYYLTLSVEVQLGGETRLIPGLVYDAYWVHLYANGLPPLDTAPGSYNAIGEEISDVYHGFLGGVPPVSPPSSTSLHGGTRFVGDLLRTLAVAARNGSVAATTELSTFTPRSTFIPTYSALGLEVSDPNYDVSMDPEEVVYADNGTYYTTHFDEVYFAQENGSHLGVTPEVKTFTMDQVTGGRARRFHYTQSTTINTNTTIPRGASVVIDNDVQVTVASGVSLTIEPGVTVTLDVGASIWSNGHLIVGSEGTDEPVVFEGSGAGHWRFIYQYRGSASFHNVRVSGARYGIHTNLVSGLVLDGVEAFGNYYNGAKFVSTTATIRGESRFHNNTYHGIFAENGDLTILDSFFEYNEYDGAVFKGAVADFGIAGMNAPSWLRYNDRYGLYLYRSASVVLGDYGCDAGGPFGGSGVYSNGAGHAFVYNQNGHLKADGTWWGSSSATAVYGGLDPDPSQSGVYAISLDLDGVDDWLGCEGERRAATCGSSAGTGCGSAIASAAASALTPPSPARMTHSTRAASAGPPGEPTLAASARAAFVRAYRQAARRSRASARSLLQQRQQGADPSLRQLASLLLVEHLLTDGDVPGAVAMGEALLKRRDLLDWERASLAKQLFYAYLLERDDRARAKELLGMLEALNDEDAVSGLLAKVLEQHGGGSTRNAHGGSHDSAAASGADLSEESGQGAPAAFAVSHHPNPFNPATTITFALPHRSDVTLVVYDVMGREVARLVDGWLPAGRHRARFDGGALASGTYLYRIEAGAYVETRALVLMK